LPYNGCRTDPKIALIRGDYEETRPAAGERFITAGATAVPGAVRFRAPSVHA